MDEKEMENTLPTIDDTVSDTPPEPEVPQKSGDISEESSYENPAEEKTELETVQEEIISSGEQKEGSPEDPPVSDFAYREESSQGTKSSDQEQGMPSSSYHYGENSQQEAPPPAYSYGGDNRQGTPPPNYGYSPNAPQRYTPKNNNGMAMASLILGILSIVMCCCCGFGIILGAIGIVLAILSRGREPMETSAKAGFCLSIGGIVLGIAVLILAFAMVSNNGLDLYRRGLKNYEDYDYYLDDYSHNHDGL